jgi:DNA polymerase-3 subunit gamma/tau
MRLFRLMASAQEEILRSPYPDLLLEMAAVRMASLAPVMDADELLRAIGAQRAREPEPRSAAGARAAPSESAGGGETTAAGTRRLRVEGEVKASAPFRAPEPDRARELPELREHIRSRRPALAGFMEQGAGLSVVDDVVRVVPLNQIYVRYLQDNRAVIAELASEVYGRRMRVELAANGATAAPAAADAAGAAAAPSGADERRAVVADPDVRKILEEFDARVVEVRKSGGPERNTK